MHATKEALSSLESGTPSPNMSLHKLEIIFGVALIVATLILNN